MTLEELKKLESAATPGPWKHGMYLGAAGAVNRVTPDGDTLAHVADSYTLRAVEDAALIAAMRNALPDLLAAVECLRDMVRGPNEGVLQPTEARAILSRLGVE